MKTSLFLVLFVAFLSESAFAWGGRGHHAICEAATFLVKEKGLRDYLTSRPQMMGHLCNMPDFYWKSLGPDVGKLGNSTHFIDIEVIGLKQEDVPTDFKRIVKKYEGGTNHYKEGAKVFSIPQEFGSLWWRADQFYRRAIDDGKAIRKATAPTTSKEEQDDSLAYNKATFSFIVNLGLIGHFVGDASQPLHCTADYDGYGTGHGGLHSFFEDAGVSVQPYDMVAKIVEEGKRLQGLAESKDKTERKKVPFLIAKTPIEKMKALTTISADERPALYAIDPVKKPSEIKKDKGMEIKTPAEREPAETVGAKFGPLIVGEMARAATLLAQLWDDAYEKAGNPKIAAYKSYKYPFTVDFVPPDYYELPKEEKSEPKK